MPSLFDAGVNDLQTSANILERDLQIADGCVRHFTPISRPINVAQLAEHDEAA
jgi:hypothetical protein